MIILLYINVYYMFLLICFHVLFVKVHFSQREALETAEMMAKASLPLKDAAALRRRLEHFAFASPFGATLQELLRKGIGVHHAGLLPSYRRLVEQLTQEITSLAHYI